MKDPTEKGKRCKNLVIAKIGRKKKSGHDRRKERRGSGKRSDFLLHLVTGNNRGCEVKWQICKDSPRTESNKFWASPLPSVQGMDALGQSWLCEMAEFPELGHELSGTGSGGRLACEQQCRDKQGRNSP